MKKLLILSFLVVFLVDSLPAKAQEICNPNNISTAQENCKPDPNSLQTVAPNKIQNATPPQNTEQNIPVIINPLDFYPLDRNQEGHLGPSRQYIPNKPNIDPNYQYIPNTQQDELPLEIPTPNY